MNNEQKELFNLMSEMKKKELSAFLVDLLTPSELEQMTERWNIIKALEAGLSQRKIAEKLGVGIATVVRGASALKRSEGGFAIALRKA